MDEACPVRVAFGEGDDAPANRWVGQRQDCEIVGQTRESDKGKDRDAKARGGEADGGVMVIKASHISGCESCGEAGPGNDSPRWTVVDVVIDPRLVP